MASTDAIDSVKFCIFISQYYPSSFMICFHLPLDMVIYLCNKINAGINSMLFSPSSLDPSTLSDVFSDRIFLFLLNTVLAECVLLNVLFLT